MNTNRCFSRLFGSAMLCLMLAVASGCHLEDTKPPFVPLKRIRFGDNVSLEVKGEQRRVLLYEAKVTRRSRKDDGFPSDFNTMEFFLTRKGSGKEYESILCVDVDARKVFDALRDAKAVVGRPVRLDPYRPPSGQTIKVLLQYEQDGKQQTVPAQSWLRTKNGGEVTLDWVFAGSSFEENEFDPQHPTIFLAQATGALMSLGNMESALLDVNVASSNKQADIDLDYNTEQIPPLGTKVTIILEPVGESKKSQK
jgi:hypothetical protein